MISSSSVEEVHWKVFRPRPSLSYCELSFKRDALVTDLRKCQEILMYRQDVTNLVKLKFFLHFENRIRTLIDLVNGAPVLEKKGIPSDGLSKLPKKVVTRESFQEVRGEGSFAQLAHLASPFTNEDRSAQANPFVRIKPNQSTIFEDTYLNENDLSECGFNAGYSDSDRYILTSNQDVSSQSKKYSHFVNYGKGGTD